MSKSVKKGNILVRKKIKELFGEKSVKLNSEALNKINDYVLEIINQIAEMSSYQLDIEGKKVLKVKELKKVIKKIEKEEESFEV